jgi:hypothetical protein
MLSLHAEFGSRRFIDLPSLLDKKNDENVINKRL